MYSRLSCPPPGNLPDPGIKPMSLSLLHRQVGSLPLATPGKPLISLPPIIAFLFVFYEYTLGKIA